MPLTGVVTHGTPHDMASINTTGMPSARLGSTKMSARPKRSRTWSCVSAPVSVTSCPRPRAAISLSMRPRSGPAPTRVRWQRTPAARSRATAWTSRIWPLAGVSRPTHSSWVNGPGWRSAKRNRSGSTPRRQTRNLPQCTGSVMRINWPRANWLMQTTASASRIFNARCWPPTSSNSSGPWMVTERWHPVRRLTSTPTLAPALPKCTCRWRAPSRRIQRATMAASTA